MKNNRISGFSLVSLSIAIGISSVVAVLTSLVIFKLSDSQKKMNMQAELDLIHMQSLQILSNQETLEQLFYIHNPNLKACFSRSSNSCASLNGAIIEPIDSGNKYNLNRIISIHQGSGTTCSAPSAECAIQKKTQMKVFCSTSDYCEKVIISIDTLYVAPNPTTSVRNHHSDLTFAARSDQQRRLIDFSCTATSSNFISGLDFKNLKAECNPLPILNTSCSTPIPLMGLGKKVATGCFAQQINANCSTTGLSQASLYSGSERCTQIGN